jgi:hypothetical protein
MVIRFGLYKRGLLLSVAILKMESFTKTKTNAALPRFFHVQPSLNASIPSGLTIKKAGLSSCSFWFW